jgi:hypothetical protein
VAKRKFSSEEKFQILEEGKGPAKQALLGGQSPPPLFLKCGKIWVNEVG